MTHDCNCDHPEVQPLADIDVLGADVVSAAEAFIRLVATTGDLASPRVRRRLKNAVAELTRIRQVFVADETREAAEVPPTRYASPFLPPPPSLVMPGEEGFLLPADEGEPIREQEPQPLETGAQRMTRELTSMLAPLSDALRGQAESNGVRAAAARADAMATLAIQIRLATADNDGTTADLLRAELRRLAADPSAVPALSAPEPVLVPRVAP